MSDLEESTSVKIRVHHTPHPPISRDEKTIFVRPSILVSASTQTSTPPPTPVSLSKHHRATKIIFDAQSKYIAAQYESLENEVKKFEQNKKEFEDQISEYKLQKISLDKKQFEQQIVDSQQIETRNELERSISEFRQDKEEILLLLQRERDKLNEQHNHYKEIQCQNLSMKMSLTDSRHECKSHTKKLRQLEEQCDNNTYFIKQLETQHEKDIFLKNEWKEQMDNFVGYLHQQVIFDWRIVVKEINTIFTSNYSIE